MQINGVNGIIFDLDGTLFDSAKDLCDSINYGRKWANLPPLASEVISTFIGDGINNLIKLSFTGSDVDLDKIKPVIASHYEEHLLDSSKPYEKVIETLDKLPQKKCIITNKPSAFVPAMLEAFNMEKYFSFIIGGDSLPKRKPDQSVGFIAAERLNLPVSEIIVIGDHSTDLELARNCGMRSIYCNYGIGKKGDFTPTITISNFSELVDCLK